MYNVQYIDLLYLLFPILFIYYVYYKYCNDKYTLPYGLLRMFSQLFLIGYILTYIFEQNKLLPVLSTLLVMLISASIISLRAVKIKTKDMYISSFISILLSGTITLFIVVHFVLHLNNWQEPRYIIPIAGMIFANSMNSISIGANRFESEYKMSNNFINSRAISFKTALIPNINSLYAVGLVSIPGMMTGQILSGTNIMVAVKYQIMVMLMIILSSGISSYIYFKLIKNKYI